jgi:tripartite-type tricarboxylate transporter receptor subunit TctC
VLRTAEVRKTFAALGVDAATSAPEELGTLIKREVPKYARLIQEIGIPKQ